MKKILFFFVFALSITNLKAQQTFTVNQGVGDSFNPVELIVNQGDIVHFNLSAPHNVTQVSLATWNANGTTPLAGGFLFASGSGNYTTTTPGTIYYVCTQHVVEHGMKGTIIVNAVTGINDIRKNSTLKVFPNPASDYITFQNRDNSSIQEIRILDLTGKSVKILHKSEIPADQLRIDIGTLSKGIYFIIVKSAQGIDSRRFVKS